MSDDYKKIFESYMESIKKIEPEITKFLLNKAKSLGGKLVDLEYKFKSYESAYRKIKSYQTEESLKDLTFFQSTLNTLKDLLRYTVVFDLNKFTENVNSFIESLKNEKYEVVRLKNRFNNEEYKDLLTNFNIKKNYNGEIIKFIFEVQFHTNETLKAKKIIHLLYEVTREYELKLNEISPSIIEKISLVQKELNSDITIPDKISSIQDIN